MNKAGKILSVDPQFAISGGEVLVNCEGFQNTGVSDYGCFFDGNESRLVSCSSKRIWAIVPEEVDDTGVEIYLESDGETSNTANIVVGKMLASNMHTVGNPAVDPNDGSLILTRSGSRGQQLPATLFRLETNGFLDEIPVVMMNPTGLAFANSGQLFVTNRAEGSVSRISRDGTVIPFGMELGVATGIAFDKNSFLYVGDRGGTIWRGKNIDDFEVFATLDPSVAAYHLAFGPDGGLYVTAPSLASYDNVWRIDEQGKVDVYYRGLGRPQGLAFDMNGNLYVAGCIRGRRGIVKVTPDCEASLFIAGNGIIGLCFTKKGELIVATSNEVYNLPVGIYGTILD
jgi:WD40 repeat protein